MRRNVVSRWKRLIAAGLLFCAGFSLGTGALAATEPVGELTGTLQGTNAPGPGVQEMPLGILAAEAVGKACGADVVILNGGDLAGNIQAGTVGHPEIEAAFCEDRELVRTVADEALIRRLLEQGFSHITVGADDRLDPIASDYGGYPQVTGFAVTFDASCPVGSRVQELELPEGKERFVLVCSKYMAEGGYGYPALTDYELCEDTLFSALYRFFDGKIVSVPSETHITMIGTADQTLISGIPTGLFWGVIAFLAIAALLGKRRRFLEA